MSGGSKDTMGPGPECRLRGGATPSSMPKVAPSERPKPDHEEIKVSSEKDNKDGEELADDKQDGDGRKKAKQSKTKKGRHRQRHDGEEEPPLSKPCCFCWCCCCSCSWFTNFLSNCVSCLCLRRFMRLLSDRNCLTSKSGEDDGRNGDPDPMDMLTCDGEPPPPLDEIRAWGKSFDKLMKSAAGRRVFRDFLRCEYSEENILFWLACEELKKESNPDLIEEKARFIYEDYISILSPREVSLDSRVRELVNRNMVDPTPRTFDEAQLQIYTLMHRDSYPRFVNSPLFRQIAQLDSSGSNGSQSGSQAATPGGGGPGGGPGSGPLGGAAGGAVGGVGA